MIWCVDHDAQRRNLEMHALRCVGMDAKGYDSADEKNRTVDIHVQTLRKKLGTCGSLIESVKYIGYRMKKVP